MAKYQKRPVENEALIKIDAFRLGIDYMPDWFFSKVCNGDVILHGTSTCFYHANDTNADIKMPDGWHHADYGDYVCKWVDDIFICKPEAFKEEYEPFDE